MQNFSKFVLKLRQFLTVETFRNIKNLKRITLNNREKINITFNITAVIIKIEFFK